MIEAVSQPCMIGRLLKLLALKRLFDASRAHRR
jgi:hypothetical protein